MRTSRRPPPQVAARTRGGLVLATKEYSDAVDKGCPMVLGGPLSHVMAAKAVALAEARQPRIPGVRPVRRRQCQRHLPRTPEAWRQPGDRGTDNHLVLLDVTSFGLTGRQAESALLDAGVVTNRNAIPSDPNGAWYTSGIRFGTPALTTRGSGPRNSTGSQSWWWTCCPTPKPPPRVPARRRPSTRWPTVSRTVCMPRPPKCWPQIRCIGPDTDLRHGPVGFHDNR